MTIKSTSKPLSSATLAALPDDFPLMFLVSAADGRILRASDDLLRIFGTSRAALIGTPVTDLPLPREALPPADIGQNTATPGRPVFAAEGGRLFECQDLPLVDGLVDGADHSADHGTFHHFLPVTDHGEVLDQLRLENRRLQGCLDGTNAGTWEWNVQTGLAQFSDRWAEIVGYSLDELLPHNFSTWERLVHPKDQELAKNAVEAHLTGQTPFLDIDIRMRHKDGQWIWVHSRGRVLSRNAAGDPEWLFGTHLCMQAQRQLSKQAERMQRLMSRTGSAAGVGGWELDLETGELTWTQETRRIHGVGDDYEPTVETAISFYPPEARELILNAVDKALIEGTPWDLELPFIRQDGKRLWVRALGEVDIRDGVPVTLFGAFLDVTDRVNRNLELARARQEAQEAQERLWSAIEALPDAFVLFDRQDRAVMFNSRYRDIYATSSAVIQQGETFENILRAGLNHQQYPAAIGREEEWLAERIRHHLYPQGPIEQELPGDRHLQIHEVRLPNGDTVGFRVDITELKRQKKELADKARALEIAATTDPLTGLNNRRGLETIMEKLAACTLENAGVGLLHLDLDRFKPINDVFGHAAGDSLLCHVSDILRRNIREEDHVARVGGDEFVVVLNHPVDEVAAARIAQRVIEQCSVPVEWQDKTLHFGASIGIALGAARELPVMLHNADIALYEAKKGGRNQHHFFNAELRQRVETRKTLSDDLLVGLGRGEIIAHYQPQFAADDGQLIGVEALARWDHPTRGLLSPAEFLDIAEEMGVLAEVDRQVFEHALDTGHRLHAQGCGIRKVSVNVSLSRLTQASDLNWLPPARSLPFNLCLEILEAVDVDTDFDQISWIFDGLRERNISVEVDDFGSGRASLTSLLKIRPNRIKLDTEIVRAAAYDPQGAGSMVRAIAEMCRGLAIPMTAEGIETRAHADLMREMGCDVLQGYFFSPPMSRQDLGVLAQQAICPGMTPEAPPNKALGG